MKNFPDERVWSQPGNAESETINKIISYLQDDRLKTQEDSEMTTAELGLEPSKSDSESILYCQNRTFLGILENAFLAELFGLN